MTKTATDESVAVDEKAEAPEVTDAPSAMPTAEAVAEGSADPGPASGLSINETGAVTLPAAPLPQFEMVRAAGGEPVYPEGLEEVLTGVPAEDGEDESGVARESRADEAETPS